MGVLAGSKSSIALRGGKGLLINLMLESAILKVRSAAFLTVCVVVVSGCVNPINPLGKFDPTPKVSTVAQAQPSEKFA